MNTGDTGNMFFGIGLTMFYLYLVVIVVWVLVKKRGWIFTLLAGVMGLILGASNFLLNNDEKDLGLRFGLAFLVALLVFCTSLFFFTAQSRKRQNQSLL